MAKKRKPPRTAALAARAPESDRFPETETFNDSEDEFFAGRDKILLDQGPVAKRQRKLAEQERDLLPSDEEVFASDAGEDEEEYDDDDDNDGGDRGPEVDGDEQEEEGENWGSNRADYYDADIIETEADALEEEAEARRLQQKQLAGMTDADFGFDDTAWADEAMTSEAKANVEKLPELQIPQNATDEERLQILRSRYPEFEALASEFSRLHPTYTSYCESMELEAIATQEKTTRVTVAKFRALSAYLGAIAVYLAVLTSSKTGNAVSPAELREHPVMATLVRAKTMWEDVKDWSSEEETPRLGTELPQTVVQNDPILQRPVPNAEGDTSDKRLKERKRKIRLETPDSFMADEPVSVQDEPLPKPAKKNRRTDLALLASSMQQPAETDSESDFGDENPLTAEEAAEKARKKKSLRFYTSQIAQKANKRGAAGRMAGGDDDVPYKERLRDKQERLMREAEARGRENALGSEGLDFDDNGSEAAGRDQENEYYAALVSNSKAKKAEKSARADAYKAAAQAGAQVYEEESIGADGKRKITYAIEKNKGLAPKRKKEVRNPRVKKKKKFEEKMKKLGSLRQVYKGGEGRGGYGGEATGIKTNVVKSIKL